MMMLVVCVEKESRQKPAPPAIRKERQTKLVCWTVVSVDSVELTSNKFAVSLITAADYELGGGISRGISWIWEWIAVPWKAQAWVFCSPQSFIVNLQVREWSTIGHLQKPKWGWPKFVRIKEIEGLMKRCKTHCCALDLDHWFVKGELIEIQ